MTTIRTLTDIAKAAEFLKDGKQAVVIGGGVVGLEAAWELKKYQCDVTILEAMPSLMSNKLDSSASHMLQEIFEANGIRILAGASTKKFEDRKIYLEDGTVIPADLVVVSCGVRANSAIAADAGVEIGRAILVNDRMETNIPDLYAAGDCVEFEGMNYALWC